MTIQPNSHLIALGDSHLEALEFGAKLNILNVDRTSFSIVPGATAVGLRNPNSSTDALNIFRSSLEPQPRNSFVLTHLGEVDCGFVIWWRAERYGESVEKQFQESINSYREFLHDVIAAGFNNLCITGATLPTIRDGLDMGDVANKRREVKISIRQRTELTLKYNEKLFDIAQDFRVDYFDITSEVMDRTLNISHEFFRNKNENDHHLDMHKIVGIWAAKCNIFLKKNSASSETKIV